MSGCNGGFSRVGCRGRFMRAGIYAILREGNRVKARRTL